jgi:hypothetical protein
VDETETSRLVIAVVAGVSVALFSFLLATVRESLKARRDTRRRRRLGLLGFVAEMQANSEAASNNLTLIAS